VLDLIAVLALMALYVWGFADTSAWPTALLRPIEIATAVGGVVSIVMIGLMWVLATHPARIGAFVTAAARVLPSRWAAGLGDFARSFSSGFAIARAPWDLTAAMLLSFPLWFVIAAESWAVTTAFHIAMPLVGSFLLQAMLVVGVAVPTPGGVGSYHEAYRFGVTTFFGAENDQAVAAAIVVHIISFVPVVLLGVLFMAQDGLSFGRLQRMADDQPPGKERMPTDEVPVLRSSGR
jgi:glycosyltransferase 2 family protein